MVYSIICSSGYSTILQLFSLKKTVKNLFCIEHLTLSYHVRLFVGENVVPD